MFFVHTYNDVISYINVRLCVGCTCRTKVDQEKPVIKPPVNEKPVIKPSVNDKPVIKSPVNDTPAPTVIKDDKHYEDIFRPHKELCKSLVVHLSTEFLNANLTFYWLDVLHGLIWKYLLCVAHTPPKNGEGELFQAPVDEGGFYYFFLLLRFKLCKHAYQISV